MLSRLYRENKLNLECFGGELNNQADYLDDEMVNKKNNTTTITIHFDQESNIDFNYNSDIGLVLNFVFDLLTPENVKQVIIEDNELEIYIY
ncbi:hypothetical protein OX284_004855 [Flavobacterium sp. SUN046]|uniref:hypothetical protein n=1 Tax=Flavobacterium sp. SUN046 TaxID=3002440 RepID=UPI002DB5B3B2|nr:hypothetical protein [Flavobacterium sp. SUN046]MEC4048750.1 hypothetical protein [Flavobacterium sp. SUN046]